MTKGPVPAWIEALSAEILETTAQLRKLTRRAHYDPPAPGTSLATVRAATGGITISTHEARTLLRAAAPASIAANPSRSKTHRDLGLAIAAMAQALLETNDGLATAHFGPAGIAAAADLRDVLDAWLAAARWQQATARSGAAWPQPAPAVLPIRALMRQSTAEPVPGLFDEAPAKPQKTARKPRPKPHSRQLSLPLPIAGGKTATPPPITATLPTHQPASRKGQAA